MLAPKIKHYFPTFLRDKLDPAPAIALKTDSKAVRYEVLRSNLTDLHLEFVSSRFETIKAKLT